VAVALITAIAPMADAVPEPPEPAAAATVSDSLPSPVPTGAPPSPPPSSPPSSVATAAPVVTVPDQVDRQWPKNPPWDACPRPVWPGERSAGQPGAGRRVLVLGDSLTRDSQALSARGMRASGWTPTFRCWGSKRLDWGIAQVRRAKSLGQLPGFVVVALGTNDISWETPPTTQRRVRILLDAIGKRRQVLWVDLDVDHSAFSSSRAQWFNRMIREVADDRANVTVVPWRRVARAASAGRFDGIHYGPGGFRLRAQTVVKALNKAGRAHPAPAPRPTVTPVPAPPSGAVPSPFPSPLPGSASASPAATPAPVISETPSGSSAPASSAE